MHKHNFDRGLEIKIEGLPTGYGLLLYLGVKKKDQVRNTTLRSRTLVAEVDKATARLKYDWAGRICRERW